ncbi:MAG: histidine phosphatase family protein [Actinomycetota bacterium]
MAKLWYVSHPEVRIDSEVPVPRWGLTDHGRARAEAMCRQPWIAEIDRIVSSDETKALELAAVVAAARGVPIDVRASQAETDRSATGFLPPEAYGRVSDAWFASPDEAPSGWEPARVVQDRVVLGLEDVFGGDQNVMVAGHGGAGTLLWCRLSGTAIAASHDQPGAGHYFTVDLATRRPEHQWRAIDDIED